MSWPRRRSAASSSSRAGQPGVSATVRTLPLVVCSRRQLVVTLTAAGGALAVSGCVVRPLYGTAGDLTTGAEDGAAGLAGISIRPIPNRSGQMLHNQLRDLLNPRGQPSDAVYDLEVALRESIRESGLRRTETATRGTDRKSTRLNSSHVAISYAVFCLKKKIKHTAHNVYETINILVHNKYN